MNDRVNDIVAERQSLSKSDPIGALVSATLHLIAAALIVASLRHESAGQKRYVSIRLAPPAIRPTASAAPRKTELPRPAVAPTPAEVVKPAPVKPTPLAPTSKGLFGKSDKTPVTPVATPNATVTPETTSAVSLGTAVAMPAVGAAGVTGLDTSFPFTPYIERMVALVGTRWFRPQGKSDLLATVYFSINRNGTITDIKLEKSSGDEVFDLAARRAVIESSPLPPLPFGYSDKFLGVHLSFH
ncbi:MAG TPA: TonB family protein [Thermoanaerobaculia bacterium]|nr:TonB family protein [Thermoanaerobaculia bacterium]